MIAEDEVSGPVELELTQQDEEIVDRIRGFGLGDKVHQYTECQERQKQHFADFYDANVKGGQAGDGDHAQVQLHQDKATGMAKALQLTGRPVAKPNVPAGNKVIGDDDLAQIRASRLAAMKEKSAMRKHWKQSGHGNYTELNSAEEFFKETKTPQRCVVLLHAEDAYDEDLHNWLQSQAAKHLECKFFHIRRDRCEGMCAMLDLQGFPTLLLMRLGQVVEWVHPHELTLLDKMEKCLQKLEMLVREDASESESEDDVSDDEDERRCRFHGFELPGRGS